MTEYNTQVRKPLNEQDFEKHSTVLFRVLLKDPNVKRVGRRGLGQKGVDLVGNRNRQPGKVVGIQCKLKGEGKKLSEAEVRREVTKALKFRPKLTEYFIVTTAGDDTAFDELTLTLQQEQKKKGRNIKIAVWGWETVEQHINENQEAKDAFDAGFSPGLKQVRDQLGAIEKGQKKQASGKQVAELAALLEVSKAQQNKLPTAYADRELQRAASIALKRRGFGEADWLKEISAVAEKARTGECSLASAQVRADVAQRAARANASPETLTTAKQYWDFVQRVDPGRKDPIYNALLADASGDIDKAVRLLRAVNTPDAIGVLFNLLWRSKGDEAAFKWAEIEKIEAKQFNAPGVINYLLKQVENGRSDQAFADVSSLPQKFFDDCPALHSIKANLILSTILPKDQKQLIFGGLPLDPRLIQLASGHASRAKIKEARAEIGHVLAQAKELSLTAIPEFLEELDLWLQLEDSDTSAAGKERLRQELSDPSKTLRRVRLALAYQVPFNQEALSRQLKVRKEIAGWDIDESFAALMLAYHSNDNAKMASFFDENRVELFKQEQLSRGPLIAIETEVLARVGRFSDAKLRLAEAPKFLTKEQVTRLGQVIDSIETGSEVERLKRQYLEEGNLNSLRVLVGAAAQKGDHHQVAEYAPTLARETKQASDFRLAVSALYNERKYTGVLELSGELSDIYALDKEFKSIRAWSLFQLGESLQARTLARELYAERGSRNDRELAINTAMESGDWGYIQSILASELAKISTLDAPTLIRLSKLALESGSPYVDQFRNAALERFPDNPYVFLSAYTLAVERGVEQHDEEAHLWFQKAVALSGKDGPVQSVPFKELLDKTKGWNEHVDSVGRLFGDSKLPIFIAAKGLRRQPVEMIIGQALRNRGDTEPAHQVPILAFSGARQRVSLAGIKHIALDSTAIFTLDFLGLLESVIGGFERVVIAPTTLSNLFLQRQFLRFGQPSQAKKAQRIINLIAEKKLKVLSGLPPAPLQLRAEVGSDLADMLTVASQEKALVVRSAPIHKLGSLLEETADLAAHQAVLTDTRSILEYLSESGKIDASVKQNAEAYLNQVDKGWSDAPAVVADAKLYLDALSVTYLDHVGVLEALATAMSEVYVHEDVEKNARALLKHSEFSLDVLSAIERIRSKLSAGMDAGRVVFCKRRPTGTADDEEDEDEFNSFPTMDLLSDLSSFEAVIADDRFLNKDKNWSQGDKAVQTATTVDILAWFRESGKISQAEYWQSMHALRQAGYSYLPIERDELLHHVGVATCNDDGVVETPELTAIRENISLPKRADIYRIADEPWLVNVRYAFVQAVRELWSSKPASDTFEARGDWLLHCLPKPLTWCFDPADQRQWAVAVQQSIGQFGLFAFFIGGDQQLRQRYAKWIDDRLFYPLEANQPALMRQVIEFAKFYVIKLLKVDDGEDP